MRSKQLDRRLLLAGDLAPLPDHRGSRVDSGFDIVEQIFGSPSAGMITLQALDTAGNPIPGQPPTEHSIRGSLIIHADGTGNQLRLMNVDIPGSLIVRACGRGHSLETTAARVGDDLLYFGADGDDSIINGTPEQVGAVVANNFLPDYEQHSPNIGDGVAAIFAAFAVEGWDHDVLRKVVAAVHEVQRTDRRGSSVAARGAPIRRGSPAWEGGDSAASTQSDFVWEMIPMVTVHSEDCRRRPKRLEQRGGLCR